MKPLLSCLLFCFALFYSASSAAYNEAMCILIKQEMQQHSHNKASRKYRNAARDFENSCSKPPAARTQPAPKLKPQPVIETTQELKPQVTKPVTQPKNAPITPEQTHAPLSEQTTNASVKATTETATEHTVSHSTAQIQNTKHEVSAITPSNASHTNKDTAQHSKAVTSEVSSKTSTPQNSVHSDVITTTVKPLQTTTPKQPNSLALILPSGLLLLVVLVGLLILVRLRNRKQKKQLAETNIPLHTSAATSNENNKHNVVNEPALPAASAHKQTTTTESTLQKSSDHSVKMVKVNPEPNTAEFEAAAKATLDRIKNARQFAEPQVRAFDPNAQPIKKQSKQQYQSVKPVSTPIDDSPAHSPAPAPMPKTPLQPKTSLPTSQAHSSNQLLNNEHNFKEPEVRTFDPNAPLSTKKLANNVATEHVNTLSPHDETNETTNKNPFANLSLDQSWDPNSTEKPIIIAKKTAPKSQALIEAELRAKNMKTID